MTVLALRLNLKAGGYSPLPVNGKRPPMDGWSKLVEASEDDIRSWEQIFPYAASTGLLTKFTPALDIDITSEPAAEAVEALCHKRFEEGYFMVRIGQAPKRAILFRSNTPFKKITAELVSPNGGSGQKLEFLCDGQQLVAYGLHAKTHKPYTWHGGEPNKVNREDLPCVDEARARQLVDDAADLLCREFGYKRVATRAHKKGNGAGGAADWAALVESVKKGRALHDSLRDLAAKLVASGMDAGAAINFLRGLMGQCEGEHDERWKERRADINRLVETAAGGQDKRDEAIKNLAPWDITQTLEVFERWLLLQDLVPVYAVLGTVAANLLPGDPVWLGIIGPPSSAKTEILNSLLMLPRVVQAATLTPAGCLSGTPKRQHDKGAKGGLLKQIGDFGIIVCKDFGTVLSMRPDAKAEVLAALREIYDGAWTRHLGTDGGRTLSWQGKIGLLFGATGVLDTHYSVIGALGDRFLLSRLAPAGEGQFDRALLHSGTVTKQMRRELAEAVAHLFAGRRTEAPPISREEIERIDRVISLVVRLRGAVERDRYSREVEAVYGAEGTARVGLALERLLAGLDTLGVDRATALDVVEAVAMHSVPPLRRRAYEYLCNARDLTGNYEAIGTTDIAEALELPTNTVRRALEDLVAYGLASRRSQGQGKTDLWTACPDAD